MRTSVLQLLVVVSLVPHPTELAMVTPSPSAAACPSGVNTATISRVTPPSLAKQTKPGPAVLKPNVQVYINTKIDVLDNRSS